MDPKLRGRAAQQPFAFHVSEDLLTSMQLVLGSSHKWMSVYHPRIEAKMLSPQDLKSWAVQRLKYAGGTLNIAFSALVWKAVFSSGRIGLHYASTLLSYLILPCLAVLLACPLFVLTSGVLPIDASGLVYLSNLIPFLVLNELALIRSTDGRCDLKSRIGAFATLPIGLFAFWLTVWGKRPKFPSTPKSAGTELGLIYVLPNFLFGGAVVGVVGWVLLAQMSGWTTFPLPTLTANLFWSGWSTLLICGCLWYQRHLIFSIKRRSAS